MPWWSTERRIRSMTLLGIFGIAGGLALAGNITSPSHPLQNTGVHAQSSTSAQPASNKADSTDYPDNPAKETTQRSNGVVKVNDENIPLPSNGSVQKTITSENGSTTINYSATHTSTSNTNSSSVTVDIHSSQQYNGNNAP